MFNLFKKKDYLTEQQEEPEKNLIGILLEASVGMKEDLGNDLGFSDLKHFYGELTAHLRSKNEKYLIHEENVPYHGNTSLRSFRSAHFKNLAEIHVYLTEDDAGFAGAEMYCGIIITHHYKEPNNEHGRNRQKELLLEQFPILTRFKVSGPELNMEMFKEINLRDKEKLNYLSLSFIDSA